MHSGNGTGFRGRGPPRASPGGGGRPRTAGTTVRHGVDGDSASATCERGHGPGAGDRKLFRKTSTGNTGPPKGGQRPTSAVSCSYGAALALSQRARRTAMKTMTKRSWCRIPTLAGSQTTNVYPDKSRSGLEVWSSGILKGSHAAAFERGDRGFAAPFDFGKITQQSRTHAGQYDYMTAVSTCIV